MLRRRWVAVVSTALLMGGFFAASLVVSPAIDHRGWYTPSDLWFNYQAAHDIAVAGYGKVYSFSEIVVPPTILLVLMPLQLLTGHLGLVTGFGISPPRPSAWPVVAPVLVLLCSTALFAADSLAESLGANVRRRLVLGVAGAVAVGGVAWWGHPEDAVSVACLLVATRASLQGRFRDSAWLAGVGIAFQPVIVLALPVVLFRAGWRRLWRLLGCLVAPVTAVLLLPALADPSDTFRQVVEQPFFPSLSRATPWLALAPRVAVSLVQTPARSGGPPRLVALAVAVGLGVWFARRPRSPQLLVLCVAVTLGLRYLFEAAVEPYYLWPPLAAGLVAASTAPARRLALCCLFALGTTELANLHVLAAPLWWPTCALLALSIAAAAPGRAGRTPLREASGAGADKLAPPPMAVPLAGAGARTEAAPRRASAP